jgi:O-antigen ligase
MELRTAGSPVTGAVRARPVTAGWWSRLFPSFDTVTVLSVFVALLFVIPARWVVPPLGAEGRPANLLAVALFVSWLVCRCSPRLVVRERQPMRTAAGVLAVAVLITYVTGVGRGLLPIEQRAADRGLLVVAGGLGVALAAADGIRRRARLDALLLAVVVGAGFMSLVGFLQYVAGIDLAPKLGGPPLVLNADLVTSRVRGDTLRVPGTAGHPIEFGVVATIVLPVALHLALAARTRNARLFHWLVVVLVATAVPFSGSRAGFLGLGAGLVVLFRWWTPRVRRNGAVLVVLSLAVVREALPGVLSTMRYLFLNLGADPSVEGRTDDYAIVLDQIRERPWFGRGFGTYIPEVYRVLDNQLLGLLVSVGVVGTAAFVAFFATAVGTTGRTIQRSPHDDVRHLAVSVRASLVVALVSSLTFDSLSFATFTGVTFLLAGVAGALWRLDRDAAADPPGAPCFSGIVRRPRRLRVAGAAP